MTDKCPCCKQADVTYRQEKHPERCAWCGYNYDTKEVVGFVPASDPFAHLEIEWEEPTVDLGNGAKGFK